VTAALVMPVGAGLVLGAVVAMNELSDGPEKKRETTGTAMEVVKTKKPPPKKKVKKPKPKPRSTPKAPPPPSVAALTGGMAGIAVEIPGLQMDMVEGADADLLGGGEEVTHTSDTVDQQPSVRRRQDIRFPPALRKKGQGGYVVLSLLIGKDGTVQEVRVLESEGPEELEQAAVQGVRSWQFTPGQYKGEPVRTWAQQRISFRLR
jgi:protein TonB